uniref:APC2 domain-containing protein n=1 Tax=Soboliphyme baturini TaxID=241478 RepID=A0A183IK86_9BILA
LHIVILEVWSLDDLCNRLKVSSVYLRNRITWWSCAGVLRECQKDVWCLVSSLPSSEERKITSFFDEEEEDLLTDTDFTNKAPNLEVYWPYISSLLKNIGSLTAERIHKLLKLCSDEGRERTSIEDVTAFLRSKVNDQVLIQVDDAYRIPDH